MKQTPLRILCAYHDPEPDWLGIPPEEDIQGHHVTVVHTYEDAKNCILDLSRGIPPFDIFLADFAIPGGYSRAEDEEEFLYPTVLLAALVDNVLIRGLGMFVPDCFESAFDFSNGHLVIVATQKCWTPLGKRDWQELLRMVIAKSAESDKFSVRDQEKD